LSEFITKYKRSHYCGSLTDAEAGQEVVLMGWTHRRRDHGGVIFVDLRDREGLVQIVFNPEYDASAHREAHRIRSEYDQHCRGSIMEPCIVKRNIELHGKEKPPGSMAQPRTIYSRRDQLYALSRTVSKTYPFRKNAFLLAGITFSEDENHGGEVD